MCYANCLQIVRKSNQNLALMQHFLVKNVFFPFFLANFAPEFKERAI